MIDEDDKRAKWRFMRLYCNNKGERNHFININKIIKKEFPFVSKLEENKKIERKIAICRVLSVSI